MTIEVSMQTQQITQLKSFIEKTLKIKVDAMIMATFIDKHNVMLKLSNLRVLKDFDKKLSADEEFLSDFVSSYFKFTWYKCQYSII